MKLLGKDISATLLMQQITERLAARGLAGPDFAPIRMDGSEPRVDPIAFNLDALAEHADATQPLPIETHRGGVGGRAVVLAKLAFRTTCQIFINEALGRQRVFNGHVRDSYAQLSAEVKRLRNRVEELEAPVPSPKPELKPKRPAKKR